MRRAVYEMGEQGLPAVEVIAPGVEHRVVQMRSFASLSARVDVGRGSAAEPHQISADYLPVAWKSIGWDPADYLGLDPALSNALLPISIAVGHFEWPKLWNLVRGLGLEAELPGIYAAFYLRLESLDDGDAVVLGVLQGMDYPRDSGICHGDLELVRLGMVVGLRVAVGA